MAHNYKTLKEIAASNPSTYRVIDLKFIRGDIRSWDDRIEVIVDHKSKFFTRKWLYKYGLACRANR